MTRSWMGDAAGQEQCIVSESTTPDLERLANTYHLILTGFVRDQNPRPSLYRSGGPTRRWR